MLCASANTLPGHTFEYENVEIPVTPEFLDAVTARDVKEDPNAPKLYYPAPKASKTATNHVRRQPQGALSGKVIYVGAGHGWTYNSGDVASSLDWFTQRPNTNGVVEDLGNNDQMTIFCNYLWNAGATVVPTRPVDFQENEIVLDQDDENSAPASRVEYAGVWSASSTPGYAKAPDNANDTYRFVTSLVTEPAAPTATARYIPNIPEAGYYPVYTWILDSNNRVNQQYIIQHGGGMTSLRVNHRNVGKGWVWLGTYYFEEGDSGYAEITNVVEAGESGGAIIADAIRFGNGMGDLEFGEGVSGYARHNEQSRYWSQISQHPSSVWDASGSHSSDNVSTPPRMAAYMNNEANNPFSGALYMGFHSNAFDGTARGATALDNSDNGSGGTPNQTLLATLVGRETNQDMDQLDSIEFPGFADWSTRSAVFDNGSIDYGEISDTSINDEMDATINEVAFHDNPDDANYLKDPIARKYMARATMQGMIRFFEQAHGESLTMPPDEPLNLRAVNQSGSTDVVLTWDEPIQRPSGEVETPGNIGGEAPTGYVIYTSANGQDFEFTAEVSGGSTTSYTITGLNENDTVFAVVSARNAGGDSFPTNVAGARVSSGTAQTLIVDGFDRNDRFLQPEENLTQSGRSNLGDVVRVRPRVTNDFSYVIPTGLAIANSTALNQFDSATNDAVLSSDITLSDYTAVIWFVGEESTVDETFSSAEQPLVESYVTNGGNLLVSGAEIGWDLGRSGFSSPSDQAFYGDVLFAQYVSDSSDTYSVSGVSGGIFDGLSFDFDDGSNGFYDAEFADVINPANGAQGVLRYDGVSTGFAGIYFPGDSSTGAVVHLAFPFETIIENGSKNVSNVIAQTIMNTVLTEFEAATSVDTWYLY